MGSDDQSVERDSGNALRYYTRKLKRHPLYRRAKAPLDAAKQAIPSALRRATQRLRHLPTVVIVGAQKAGTTQLYSYLTTHPRILPGAKKEIDYFSKHAQRSVDWYQSQFPLRYRVAACAGHVLDASPSYLATPAALRRMRAVLPDAQVIVLLRDPVSRAFSHYQHHKTRHVAQRTFEEAIDEEIARNDFPPDLRVALKPDALPMLGYVARGYYALQLELLFRLYPRDRVLVIDSADLFADTSATCQRVFSFLGIESREVRTSKIYNRGYYKEKIEPAVAQRLRQHYEPYDELLTQLLGTRFGWVMRDQNLAA